MPYRKLIVRKKKVRSIGNISWSERFLFKVFGKLIQRNTKKNRHSLYTAWGKIRKIRETNVFRSAILNKFWFNLISKKKYINCISNVIHDRFKSWSYHCASVCYLTEMNIVLLQGFDCDRKLTFWILYENKNAYNNVNMLRLINKYIV